MKISHLQELMRQLPANAKPTDAAWRSAYLRQVGIAPGDIYQELEMESRYVDTHYDVSFANAHVNLHSHNFYELLHCANTCGAEYLVGTERYRLQKGDIILIPPGVSHRPLLPEHMPQPYERQVLWINAELMEHLHHAFPELYPANSTNSIMLRTSGTRWEYLGHLFQNGLQESQTHAACWELALIGNTVTLLTHLHRALLDRASGSPKAEKPELLDRAMAYVEERLEEKITLSQIARHFYVSDSTISHLFKQKMGVSFYRYVTQRRLIAAKTLIEKGQLLEDVASQTGFSDYSGFYRAFKQEYGISPRQYRTLQEAGGRYPPLP